MLRLASSLCLASLLALLPSHAQAIVGLKRPTELVRTEQFGQLVPDADRRFPAGVEYLGMDPEALLGYGVYSVATGDRITTLLAPFNNFDATRILLDMNDDGVSEVLGLIASPAPNASVIGLQQWTPEGMVAMFPDVVLSASGLRFLGTMRLNPANPRALVFTSPRGVYIIRETGTVRYNSDNDPSFPPATGGTLDAFIADFDADGFDDVCVTFSPTGLGTFWNVLLGDTNPVANVAGEPGGTQARLLPSRPNPSRGSARIAFEIPRPAQVQLQIYDASGRLVNRLADGPMGVGLHERSWDGRDLSGRRVAGGVYFYELVVDGARETRKLVQLR